MQTVLKVWFLASAAVLAAATIWAFAPVLVPVLGLTAGLGGLVAIIVAFARRLERQRGVRHDG
ncbi:MAG: hypothetical protein AB7L90_17100 [Hyphomicrobiaceae bacterium]